MKVSELCKWCDGRVMWLHFVLEDKQHAVLQQLRQLHPKGMKATDSSSDAKQNQQIVMTLPESGCAVEG